MVGDSERVMKFQLPTDLEILKELQNGRNIGANVADEIDKHRKTVNPRLRQLEDYGLVHNIGRGVYELSDAGRVVLDHADEMGDKSTDFEQILADELDENTNRD